MQALYAFEIEHGFAKVTKSWWLDEVKSCKKE